MKIVVAQHKGGVGKTTLAVHIAGVLSERFNKALIVDCDTQGDAYRFFTSEFPSTPLEIKKGMDYVDVVWNPERERFSNKVSFNEYEHLVVDVDTRIVNSLQVISEASPDIILIPLDKQKLSHTHGCHVVEMLREAEGVINYPAKKIIIQMGSNWEVSQQDFPGCLNYTLPYEQEFDNCLNNSDYIWNSRNNLKFMMDLFKEIITNV